MSSVGDILKRPTVATRNFSNVNRSFKDIEAASARLQTQTKYTSLAEVDADGLGKKVESLRSKLTVNENYKRTIFITEPKLKVHASAPADLKAVLDEFNGSVGSNSVLTEAQISDKALSKLSEILQRRHEGVYIFGGKDGKENPLIKDIVANNNLINGEATTNYTNASEDLSSVNMTDEISVRKNRLYASMPEIQQMIELFHGYKDGSYNLTKLNEKFSSVEKSLSEVIVAVGMDIDSINGVGDQPGALHILANQATDISSELTKYQTIDLVEETSNFKSAIFSSVTNFEVMKARNRLLEQLTQFMN